MTILKVTFANVTPNNFDILADAVNIENMSYSLNYDGGQQYSLIFDQAGHGDRVARIVGQVAIYSSIIIQTEMLGK